MAKLTSVFNKESIQKHENHPKRITKWIHYTKLKQNDNQDSNIKKSEIEALADLIEADGEVIQNLLVRKIDTDEYEIIGGHKRTLACKLLAEERGKEEFAFLPCIVQNISDIRAEFQFYSSNGYHEKTAYEKMHELERMEYLLNNYPEEFPHLQSGRMVERLAQQFNMRRATVGEYQSISKKLADEAMEKFKEGDINKSAAVTLSRMPVDDQIEIVKKGITKDCEIKKFKEKNLEPNVFNIEETFHLFNIEQYDQTHSDRKNLAKDLKEKYGKDGYQNKDGGTEILCSKTHIEIAGKKITWERFVKLLEKWFPYKNGVSEKKSGETKERTLIVEEIPQNHDLKEECTRSPFYEMETITDKELFHNMNRKKYMETLSLKEMAQYIRDSLNPSILDSIEDIMGWLEEVVTIK